MTEPKKTALEYRARVIQLESFLARIGLVHELTDDEQEIMRYVLDTSIARTEDYDATHRCNVPWQQVTPFEETILGQHVRGYTPGEMVYAKPKGLGRRRHDDAPVRLVRKLDYGTRWLVRNDTLGIEVEAEEDEFERR